PTFPQPRRRRENGHKRSLGESKPGESFIIPGLKMGGRSHRCVRLGRDLAVEMICNVEGCGCHRTPVNGRPGLRLQSTETQRDPASALAPTATNTSGATRSDDSMRRVPQVSRSSRPGTVVVVTSVVCA